MPSADKFPTTIDAAVRVLLGLVPTEELAKITQMSEGDLIDLHFGLGQWIRNNFGLWKENLELMQATGAIDPDDASGVIVKALWQRLQDELLTDKGQRNMLFSNPAKRAPAIASLRSITGVNLPM